MKLLWPSCEHVTSTVSDGLDRRLSAVERASVVLHSLVCPGCRVFRRQLVALREVFRRLRSRGEARDKLPDAFLPAVARERIQKVLEERMHDSG